MASLFIDHLTPDDVAALKALRKDSDKRAGLADLDVLRAGIACLSGCPKAKKKAAKKKVAKKTKLDAAVDKVDGAEPLAFGD